MLPTCKPKLYCQSGVNNHEYYSAKWETVGHGKAKTDVVTHVCGHCGSKEAFCTVKKVRASAPHEEK